MKKEDVENDRTRDAWLGPLMRSPLVTAPDPCLDADMLSAWGEGSLDARAAARVEQHASNCSRCMAVLASLERTTPPPEPPKAAWSPGALWRWLVPLTAAATAVALWVAVPHRPITEIQSSAPVSGAVPPAANSEPQAASGQPAAPSELAYAERLERRSESLDQRQTERPREESTARAREPQEPTFSIALGGKSAPAPPGAAPVPAPEKAAPSAPVTAVPAPAAPRPGAAAGTANDTAQMTVERQAAPAAEVPTSESTSLTNAQIRWRVMGWATVERSIDGGRTWIKTAPPPGIAAANGTPAVSIVSVRTADGLRASITTSDGREFYTTNGGLSWQRLQGNSPAPF